MKAASINSSARSDVRWPIVRLADVCELNPRRPVIERSDDAPTTFVSMSAVDENGHGISGAIERPYRDVKKGYTYFTDGDVLFAKITPCMQNGKHAIACDLIDGIGFGSTEFHVIRAGKDLLSAWIHRFLLQSRILRGAEAQFTGSVGQQRVPTDYLANLRISLPPLREQKRIAARLNEQLAIVERARAAAEERTKAASHLFARFLEQALTRPVVRSAARRPLGTVCDIVARQVDPTEEKYGALPHVNGENIESGTLRLSDVRSAFEDGMTSGKYLFEPGEVLYSKLRPYLRKVCIADFRGVCSADMYPIRPRAEYLDAQFLAYCLVSDEFTAYADEESRRARMPKLNREQLFAWNAPIPSLAEQRALAAEMDSLFSTSTAAATAVQNELEIIERMPDALLRTAFEGAT